MNDLLALVTEVSLEPEEGTSVRALIDMAEADLNMPHAQAVRYVVGIRRQARFDKLCAQTKPVIEVHSPYYIDIREECRAALGLALNVYVTLGLDRHWERMRLVRQEYDVIPSLNLRSTAHVTLNPRYVLKLLDTLDFLREMEHSSKRVSRRTLKPRRGGQHSPS